MVLVGKKLQYFVADKPPDWRVRVFLMGEWKEGRQGERWLEYIPGAFKVLITLAETRQPVAVAP